MGDHRALCKDLAIEQHAASREAFAAGDLGEAARAAGRAIDEMEKAVGAAHPDYAAMLVNFAELSVEAGEYVGALELHRRAIAIYERSPGSEEAHAVALRGASVAHRALGQLSKARELLVSALELLRRHGVEGDAKAAIEGEIEELG